MSMTTDHILAKARERAGEMAKILNQAQTMDFSSKAAVSEVRQLSESYRLEMIALGDLVRALFKTLPDGTRIFAPDLEAIEHVGRAIGETVEQITTRAKIEDGRVVSLQLHKTPVQDLQPLAALTELREVGLWATNVRELEPLGSLTKLQVLGLTSTPVKDVEPLAALSQLSRLSLVDTKVESLEPLAKLPALKELHISRSAKTEGNEGMIRYIQERGVHVSFS